MQTTPPPLTTTFTPAPTCFSDIYIWNNTQGLNCIVGEATQTCRFNSLGPPSTSACLPSGFNSSPQSYFSPGRLNLPDRKSWPWYSTQPCTYGASFAETWPWTSSTDGGWTTGTSTAVKGLNAFGISIRWQSTDFASTPTATSTSRSSPGATISADQTMSTSHATTETSSSLSTGSKAGIGVGVGVGALILIAITYVLFRQRRRQGAIVKNTNSKYLTMHKPARLLELQAREAANELDSGTYDGSDEPDEYDEAMGFCLFIDGEDNITRYSSLRFLRAVDQNSDDEDLGASWFFCDQDKESNMNPSGSGPNLTLSNILYLQEANGDIEFVRYAESPSGRIQ
ncbi:uncharacterized protein ATNIH1004_002593 [Aspergillus tanneri]|uniref:Mid2 domain-containing protein n=1 Tax=Aspergillus tanneri TaxID=1220188 RepID=A0A5M9MX33_9EURO|nr:uncharacterized protein ATNIH1004_002593 [Aspergillus tanneri]KAA8649914.1 hypothetical protein ATNIH1004_002593 [Aspergillus tanneri]